MTETIFKLKEKTTLLHGSMSNIVQAIGAFLIEQGSDVAFVSEKASQSQRIINNLMEMRQAYQSFGRSAAIEVNVTDSKSAQDAFSRSAQTFGSLEIFIDASPLQKKTERLQSCKFLADQALEIFNARRRGRILFLTYSDKIISETQMPGLARDNSELQAFVASKKNQVKNKNVTINILQVGLTEELVLQLHPGQTIQSAFKLEKQKQANLILTEPIDISQVIGFLASPLSCALNGQTLSATY